MSLLVLWDIDHTLIENAGVSKEIYAAAFAMLTGVGPHAAARTEGRTDRLIMQGMFRDNDLREPAWSTIEAALEQAGQERLDVLRVRGHALPGVRDLLKAVAAHERWISSVLTGNVEGNARVKLAAFGLDSLVDFAVGAYGADADERADLVAVAIGRAHSRGGVVTSPTVVLIGDTPRDVEAARLSGAHVIAVATGIHSESELISAGAPLVLPDLGDTEAVLRLLETFDAA